MTVRTPPRPPYERKKGRCAMCGAEPPGRRRSWCSDACVDFWLLATDPKRALRELLELHGRECWRCGALEEHPERRMRYRDRYPDGEPHCGFIGPPRPEPVKLELEHVRPLWSLTPEERRELRWWLPFNLQLLCRPCHREKTRREAADRAAIRRGGQPAGAPNNRLSLFAE